MFTVSWSIYIILLWLVFVKKNDPKVEPCLDTATDSKIARLEIRDAGSDESSASLGGGWKID